MGVPLGLRERKKQQTRDAIVRESLRLFADRGFETTTIADIAAAADIAPRTFFGYFPSKEAVVFHDFDDLFNAFADRLRTRGPDETAFDAMRAWIIDRMAEASASAPEEQLRNCLVHDTPSLEAQDRANMARLSEVLTESVAQDLGVAPDSLRAGMVSAAAVAALESLRAYKDDDVADPDRALAVMDEAMIFLQGGLEALRAA